MVKLLGWRKAAKRLKIWVLIFDHSGFCHKEPIPGSKNFYKQNTRKFEWDCCLNQSNSKKVHYYHQRKCKIYGKLKLWEQRIHQAIEYKNLHNSHIGRESHRPEYNGLEICTSSVVVSKFLCGYILVHVFMKMHTSYINIKYHIRDDE